MSLYPENPSGQVLPITSQDTYANYLSPLSVIGSGGSGPSPTNPNPQFSTVTTSTITLNTLSNAQGNSISLNAPPGDGLDNSLLLKGYQNTLLALDGVVDFQLTGKGGETIQMDEGIIELNKNCIVQTNGDLATNNLIYISTLNFQTGIGVITNLSTINGAPYSAGATPTPNPTFSTVGISSILNFQANTGVITNLSSVNGSPYVAGGGAVMPNPTFSTIQVSTIQTPVTVSNITGGIAFNTVIGGMRIIAGLAYPVTNAGITTVTYPTPFATIPTVLTGCTGGVGVNTTAMLISAGENSLGLTVNVATSTYVNWIAFGAA